MLTDQEIAILRSRFQAGASGHRQQVKATYLVPADLGALEEVRYPWAVLMPNGQAGLLLSAVNVATLVRGVYFFPYITEHTGANPTLVFPFDTFAFGVARWNTTVVAIARDDSSGDIYCAVSADNGRTWSSPASTGLNYPSDGAYWGALGDPAFQLVASYDGTTLYIFSKENGVALDSSLQYRSTVSADPLTGWSGLTASGLLIPTLRRNYGGATARNQGEQRAFIVSPTTTASWLVACESDDGDWHANHMITRGTIGGAWVRVLDMGTGGGLSGGQGGNGGVFLDADADPIAYVFTDDGGSAFRYRSLDAGATWEAPIQMVPDPYTGGVGLGAGGGVGVPSYTGRAYVWGRRWDDGALIAHNFLSSENLVVVFGSVTLDEFVIYDRATADWSDRVMAIGLESSIEMDSDSMTLTFHNVDRALSYLDTLALYHYAMKPGTEFEVFQWHGDVANKEQTFTGKAISFEEDENAQTVTFRVQDAFFPLLNTEILPTAPQTLDDPDGSIDMGNYVYVTKTVNEVLEDLFLAKGSIAAGALDLATSSFVFELTAFQTGSVGDAILRTCAAAGLRVWADRMGIFRTEELTDLTKLSYWTFDAGVDLTTLGVEVSDDDSFTHITVVGTQDDPEADPIVARSVATGFWASWGEARTKVIRDLNARTLSEAQYVADNAAARYGRFKTRLVIGIIGNPGLDKTDRVTLVAPAQNLDSDWRVLSLRLEQDAQAGTYLGVMVVEPWA